MRSRLLSMAFSLNPRAPSKRSVSCPGFSCQGDCGAAERAAEKTGELSHAPDLPAGLASCSLAEAHTRFVCARVCALREQNHPSLLATDEAKSAGLWGICAMACPQKEL